MNKLTTNKSSPGIYLHNGLDKKCSIVAAAGDVSQWAARPYAFNPHTIVMLPPINPRAATSSFVREHMHGIMSKKHGVVFRFSVEAGEKATRQRFEWRKRSGKDKDKDQDIDKGFSLYRFSRSSKTGKGLERADSEEDSDYIDSSEGEDLVNDDDLYQDGEEIASIKWISLGSSITHYFTLEMKGSAVSGLLGDRCMLMVVITALRICTLRIQGRTTKMTMMVADKTRKGKDKCQ